MFKSRRDQIKINFWKSSVVQTYLGIFTSAQLEKQILHRPGIGPGSPAWQASILPLNHRYLFIVYTINERIVTGLPFLRTVKPGRTLMTCWTDVALIGLLRPVL